MIFLQLLVALALPALAQVEHKPLFREPWGGIYCTQEVRQVHDTTGTRTLLSTPSGPVTILVRDGAYRVQFPRHSCSVEPQLDGSLKIRFGPDTYLFKTTKTSFLADLPKDDVRYVLTYGRLTGVKSMKGDYSIRTNFQQKTYTFSGINGRSRFAKQGQQLVLLEGPGLEELPYLVRGFRFEDPEAGVGVFVRVPGGELTDALPWSGCPVITPPAAWNPPPASVREPGPLDAVIGPGNDRDPLKAVVGPGNLKATVTEGNLNAAPAENPEALEAQTSQSNPLKAQSGTPGEDPLGVRQHFKKLDKKKTPPPAYDPAIEDLIVQPGEVVPTQAPGQP